MKKLRPPGSSKKIILTLFELNCKPLFEQVTPLQEFRKNHRADVRSADSGHFLPLGNGFLALKNSQTLNSYFQT